MIEIDDILRYKTWELIAIAGFIGISYAQFIWTLLCFFNIL